MLRAFTCVALLLLLLFDISQLYEASARLQKMAECKSLVPCRRGHATQVLTPTEELLPGDVIRLHDHAVVPCDLLLLHGSYLMDESLVSGESSPVLKVHLSLLLLLWTH